MEYNREDKRKKKRKKKKTGKNKTKNLQITATTGTLVNENMNFDENKKERLRFKCGFPSLKTIGEQIQMLTRQLQMFQKVESGVGPIFKVVLEC